MPFGERPPFSLRNSDSQNRRSDNTGPGLDWQLGKRTVVNIAIPADDMPLVTSDGLGELDENSPDTVAGSTDTGRAQIRNVDNPNELKRGVCRFERLVDKNEFSFMLIIIESFIIRAPASTVYTRDCEFKFIFDTDLDLTNLTWNNQGSLDLSSAIALPSLRVDNDSGTFVINGQFIGSFGVDLSALTIAKNYRGILWKFVDETSTASGTLNHTMDWGDAGSTNKKGVMLL